MVSGGFRGVLGLLYRGLRAFDVDTKAQGLRSGAHVAFELPLSRVALAFGRDRSTAAHACHRIEDRRDDRAFDDYMDALEAALRTAPRLSGLQRLAGLERLP